MSIITLFTRKAPEIGGFQFDAVFEDTFESEVDVTQFPIESGASATDHRIVKPLKWSVQIAVSNNPLKTEITDFTGLLSNFGGGGLGATVAGMAAGLLSGSEDTRASETLSFLLTLMTTGEPVDIDAGDIQLVNMVITNITRVKTTATENGLVCDVQMQELPTLDTIVTESEPKQDQLNNDDPSKSQAAESVDKGEQSTKPASANDTASAQKVNGNG